MLNYCGFCTFSRRVPLRFFRKDRGEGELLGATLRFGLAVFV